LEAESPADLVEQENAGGSGGGDQGEGGKAGTVGEGDGGQHDGPRLDEEDTEASDTPAVGEAVDQVQLDHGDCGDHDQDGSAIQTTQG
jgi:hypothetical protein